MRPAPGGADAPDGAGPAARAITTPRPIDPPHGLDSPIGRTFELDAQILVLGVGHDANTTIHLAENVAGLRYRLPKHVLVRVDGQERRLDYDEIDHCCERFDLVGDWLAERGLERRGTVGHAEARLMRARDVVEVAVERLRECETVFLHPPGVDVECDEARASLRAR